MSLAEDSCGTRTVLVVGHDWEKVLAACGPLQGFFVRNDDYASGIASSIARGVSAIAHCADAVLLLLADQPLITTEHLRSMIEEWLRSPDRIVISEYAGVQGPPVVFPAACFDDLCKLRGDQGARSLVDSGKYEVKGLRFDAAAVDVDTPEDLTKIN